MNNTFNYEINSEIGTGDKPLILLGRFEVEEELYRSGASTVYKAYDMRMERTIVLKRIPASKKTKARALREAKTVALLNHPNIVTIFEFIEDPEAYFLVMEYVEGYNLKQVLDEQGRFDIETGIALITQICYGLEYAHNNDVIHRDIKPENLMILPDGRVKIMDFGIAHLRDSSISEQGMIVGTLSYMSPEQANGELVDERSDIFSLGVVTYEVLTGINPFYQDTAPATIMKITEMQPERPSVYNMEIDEALERFILKALNKDPDDRYDYVTDLRYKLERARKTTTAPEILIRRAVGEIFDEGFDRRSDGMASGPKFGDRLSGVLAVNPFIIQRIFPAFAAFSLASFLSLAVSTDPVWRLVFSLVAGIIAGISPASGFFLFAAAFFMISLLYLPLAIFFTVLLLVLMYLLTRADDKLPFYFALLFPLLNISMLAFLGLAISAFVFKPLRAGVSVLSGLILAFLTGSFLFKERSLFSLDLGAIDNAASGPVKAAGAITTLYIDNNAAFIAALSLTALTVIFSLAFSGRRSPSMDIVGILVFYLVIFFMVGTILPVGIAEEAMLPLATSFFVTVIIVPLLTPYGRLKKRIEIEHF